VMIVSPDPASLTEWAVGFLALFQERPRPRVGLHYGEAVYRDGDYFGTDVNLVHRVVNRALGGEVLATDRVVAFVKNSEYLVTEPIGAVELKGFTEPTPLFLVRAAGEASTDEQVLAGE
jgi:adenylate cyclase